MNAELVGHERADGLSESMNGFGIGFTFGFEPLGQSLLASTTAPAGEPILVT
jgi:hypothetical protein